MDVAFDDASGMLRVNLLDHSSVELIPPAGSTLAAVDGLYWDRGRLIGVQNGIVRIVRIALSPDGMHAADVTVLESRTAFTELP